MRRALLALALLFATPAAAQQNPAEVQRAAAALAAIWRPVDGPMTATTPSVTSLLATLTDSTASLRLS